MPPEPQMYLQAASQVRASITEYGGMLLDLRGRGRWHALSAVAALWWQYLTAGTTVSAAAERIAAHYDVAPERVRADGEVLVGDLLQRGLLATGRPVRRKWLA